MMHMRPESTPPPAPGPGPGPGPGQLPTTTTLSSLDAAATHRHVRIPTKNEMLARTRMYLHLDPDLAKPSSSCAGTDTSTALTRPGLDSTRP
ncbi:hypothetical protein GCG54_00005998 [Colletotrichum gloeosporioides]|uniref:Uncharacterized protein n=1 Tax=Colletotrichum gloeosporioides TaxID=474922 RepID=A0A8H4CM07_COLGL|nr:uncharacterized protein GCG54_00005998 [Colletotrichum gloeosporioides]KAF3806236.1 hypothetical protein GCG54_00005998 [Colletotrichum gloeosporioides]